MNDMNDMLVESPLPQIQLTLERIPFQKWDALLPKLRAIIADVDHRKRQQLLEDDFKELKFPEIPRQEEDVSMEF